MVRLPWDLLSGQSRESYQPLMAWWGQVHHQGPRAFLGMRYTLTHWREEILNYYAYPITNSFAEGMNNRKAIVRAAYGYRNMGIPSYAYCWPTA